MSQNSFQQIRQNFAKEKRRQQINQIFRQRRKINSEKLVQKQRQIFEQLLPNISIQSYEENRHLLAEYARSNTYSYQMLPITFISFEYLLIHPSDSPSWQIITYLSDYEDFEIAQTEQFVQIVLKYLNQDPELMSQFIFNISKLSKCSLLCCRLIDASLFYIIQEKLQEIEEIYLNQTVSNKFEEFRGKEGIQLQIHNFLFALCSLFSIQPLIEIYQMNKICEIISLKNTSNKFINKMHYQATFDLLQNASQNVSHQSQVIKLLFDKFSFTIENQFFSFSRESIKFIECCIKNKVELTQSILKILIGSFTNQSNNKLKAEALRIVRKILDGTNKKQKMEVEPNNLKSLEPYIQKGYSVSLEDFNSMFSQKNSNQNNIVYEEQIRNCIKTCSILFSQNYEEHIRKLLQVYSISNQQIRQQIGRLMQSMISLMIREMQGGKVSEGILSKSKQKVTISLQRMEELLYETMQTQQFMYWMEQCLKDGNVNVIDSVLRIMMKIMIYLRDYDDEMEEGNDGRIDFRIIKNKIVNSSIYTSLLQNLVLSQNSTISNLADDLLEIIGEIEI